MRALLLALLVLPVAAAAQPESHWREGPHRQSGPRLGMTYLSPGVVERINGATDDGGIGDRIDPAFPFISQFGWQFEFETFRTPTGAMGVAEIVPLLSGLDRGLVVPSLTVLTGVRTSSGFELGAGPNVSLSPRATEATSSGEPTPLDADVRVGLALALGGNARVDGLSVPLTGAVVFGAGGPRVSFLIGLNTSNRRY